MEIRIIVFLIIQSCILSGQSYTRVKHGKLCENTNYLYAPSAMYEDGLYKIWACRFAGFNDNNESEGDGAHYKEAAEIDDFYDQNEWVVALSRNDADPSAHDHSHVCDPNVIKGSNGTYYMYYASLNEQEESITKKTRIGYATSLDGKLWTRGNNGEPIVDIEQGDSFSPGYYGIGQPAVVELNGWVYMIYTYLISENVDELRVIRSTSYDFSNYELVEDDIFLDGKSVDMAYDEVKGKFVVIVNGLAYIHLHYFNDVFDKNSVASKAILAGDLPNFGEGIGLITTPEKRLLFPHVFGGVEYDLPYCFIGATNSQSGSPIEHVQGDMWFEVYESDAGCAYNSDQGEIDHFIFGDGNNKLSSFTTESQISDQTFYIESNLNIDYPVTFQNCTFYFSQDASLYITAIGGLVDIEGCTLTSCGDSPWSGVKLLDGSNTNFGIGTLIEHSVYGVEARDEAVTVNFLFATLKDNRHAATFINANHTVNFQDTRIFASDTEFETFMGQNMFGVIIQNNKNVSRFGNCNFENLHFGISTGNAIIQLVGSNYFTDIGSSDELVVNGSPAIAIKCNNNSYADIRAQTTFTNCSQGIVFNNSAGNVVKNVFDVYTNAVKISYSQQYTLIDDNEISTKLRGVDALNSNVGIYDNEITVLGDQFSTYSAAITASVNNEIVDVVSNTIYLENHASGINLTNTRDSDISENTIITTDNNFILRNGIGIFGGGENTLRCNYLENNNSNDYHYGVTTSSSNDNSIINNVFEGHLFGYYLSTNSALQTLELNKFQSGTHAMILNSSLMVPQDYHGNRWTKDGYTSSDVIANLQGLEIEQSQFLVNDENQTDGTGYPFNPENVTLGLFDDSGDGINNNLYYCTGSPGDDETIDNTPHQLEILCKSLAENDTLTCEERWLQNYQLYQLTKLNIDSSRLVKHSCLSEFMEEIDSTDIGLFSTIDSLLLANVDSTLVDDIDSLYGVMIEDRAFNPRASTVLDSLTILRDSTKLEDYTLVDSLLSTTGDTCQLSNVWSSVYEALYIELSQDTLRNPIDLRELEAIANLCPEEYGHVIYIARDLMSRKTGKFYDVRGCEERVDPRQRSSESFITSNTDLEIMPNPSSDMIYFEISKQMIVSAEVFNINGYKVPIEVNIIDASGSIDVSNLAKGMYILTCRTNAGIATARFLVI